MINQVFIIILIIYLRKMEKQNITYSIPDLKPMYKINPHIVIYHQ